MVLARTHAVISENSIVQSQHVRTWVMGFAKRAIFLSILIVQDPF